MEAAERAKLEEEIRTKQEEVQRIQTEVELKDSETRRLQDEVEEARRKQDEAAALLAAATTPQHHHVAEDGGVDDGSDHGEESGGGDLHQAPDDLVDPVEARTTLAEKNERLHNQLKVTNSALTVHRGKELPTYIQQHLTASVTEFSHTNYTRIILKLRDIKG